MNSLRSRAMIASAMSFVRPAGRRSANRGVNRAARSAGVARPDVTTVEAADPGEDAVSPARNSLEPADDRGSFTSCALIGW
jgi:hypothetical protein